MTNLTSQRITANNMRQKILKLSTVFLFLFLIGISCQKDEDLHTVLNGKWIFIGYGKDSSNEFEAEPDDEPKNSYVIFNNGEMKPYSSRNTGNNMTYEIIGQNQLVISGGLMTMANDTEWGIRFLTFFLYEKTITFSMDRNELFLYKSDTEFMKFKKEHL